MLKVQVLTPFGLYHEGEAASVHVTTIEGETTLLPNHIPFAAMLKECPCILQENGKEEVYALAGGLLCLSQNQVTILSDAVEKREQIDVERAKRAKQRAQERLANPAADIDVKRAQAALQRALNRIRVYER